MSDIPAADADSYVGRDVGRVIVCGLCGFEYVYPHWHKTPAECLEAAHEQVRRLKVHLAELERRESDALASLVATGTWLRENAPSYVQETLTFLKARVAELEKKRVETVQRDDTEYLPNIDGGQFRRGRNSGGD